jgi:hypothetical protein
MVRQWFRRDVGRRHRIDVRFGVCHHIHISRRLRNVRLGGLLDHMSGPCNRVAG